MTSSEFTALYRKMRAGKSCFRPSSGLRQCGRTVVFSWAANIPCWGSAWTMCYRWPSQEYVPLHGNWLREFVWSHISSGRKVFGFDQRVSRYLWAHMQSIKLEMAKDTRWTPCTPASGNISLKRTGSEKEIPWWACVTLLGFFPLSKYTRHK